MLLQVIVRTFLFISFYDIPHQFHPAFLFANPSSSLPPADDEFIEHLKSLSPSTADLELRSLSPGDGSSINEPLHFVRAMTARLAARRDYELTQAWMTVFLRLHFDLVIGGESGGEGDDAGGGGDGNAALAQALREWRELQARERDRLDGLVGYCGGVVGFLRNPRT